MSGWDNVSDMKAALPDGKPKAHSGPTDLEPDDNPSEPWGEKTAYEYNESGEREWDGSAQVYEWDGEEGDLGPEHPELEKVLFGDTKPAGIDFSK
jgi:ATP-dependent RNA helicase DDX3X